MQEIRIVVHNYISYSFGATSMAFSAVAGEAFHCLIKINNLSLVRVLKITIHGLFNVGDTHQIFTDDISYYIVAYEQP